MSAKQEHVELKFSTALGGRWEVMFADLALFISLCIARLMVRRTLRRQRNEREARLRRIKLVPRINHENGTG